jgi:hypothetical protein
MVSHRSVDSQNVKGWQMGDEGRTDNRRGMTGRRMRGTARAEEWHNGDMHTLEDKLRL